MATAEIQMPLVDNDAVFPTYARQSLESWDIWGKFVWLNATGVGSALVNNSFIIICGLWRVKLHQSGMDLALMTESKKPIPCEFDLRLTRIPPHLPSVLGW